MNRQSIVGRPVLCPVYFSRNVHHLGLICGEDRSNRPGHCQRHIEAHMRNQKSDYDLVYDILVF